MSGSDGATVEDDAVARAWHEAGHAVIAWAQGLPVEKVTIAADPALPRHAPTLGVPGSGAGTTVLAAHSEAGQLTYSKRANTRRRVEAFARALLAGDASRRRAGVESAGPRQSDADRSEACGLLALVCRSEEEIEEHVRLLEIQTAHLVALHWDLIATVQRALRERTELDAIRMGAILRAGEATP